MCRQLVDRFTSTFCFLEAGPIRGVGGERICMFPCEMDMDVIE